MRFSPLLIFGLSWLPLSAAAQKYVTALGVRLGGADGNGLTVQQAVGRRYTLEAIGGLSQREWRATVLAQHHYGILGPSLNYYFGLGGHYGRNLDTGPRYGFDAIVGVEYKVAFLPLVLSLDLKPELELSGGEYGRFPTALSVRYVLVKRRQQLLRRAWPFRK